MAKVNKIASRQRAAEHRSNEILKEYRKDPSLHKGASWWTRFFGDDKYSPQAVDFHRMALNMLVGRGLLEKTQKVYNGKIGNSYRLREDARNT